MKLFFIKPAYAQITNPVIPTQLGSGGQGGTIVGGIIGGGLGLVIILGAILAIIALMVGAVRWITSGGDKTKLQQAQEQITQGIVGLIVLASIWAIITLVFTFTGLGDFTGGGGIFQLPSMFNSGAAPPINMFGG